MSDLGFDEDFMATMLGDFLDESQGYLSRLNDNLLVLDELVSDLGDEATVQADSELLNEMFRDAHSLKGLSAMLQLDNINKVTHRVENVFDAARRDSLGITRNLTDLMFQAVDRLTGMVDQLKQPDVASEEIEYQSVLEQLQRYVESQAGDAGSAPTAEETAAEPEQTPEQQVASQAAAVPTDAPSAPELDATPQIDPTPAADAAPIEIMQTEVAPSEISQSLDPEVVDDVMASVVDETDIPEKYLSIFIDETEELLDELSELLVAEQIESVDPLLVTSHRIKGAAASIGLNRAAKLAHAMEDLLQDGRDSGRELTSQDTDALLSAVDALRSFLVSYKSGEVDTDSMNQAYQLLSVVRAMGTQQAAEGDPTAETLAEQTATPEDSSPDERTSPEDGGASAEDSTPSGSEAQSELTSSSEKPAEEPATNPVDPAPSAAPSETTAGSTNLEAAKKRVAAQAPADTRVIAGFITLETGLALAEVKVNLIYDRLNSHGELIHSEPAEGQLEGLQDIESIAFGLVSESQLDEIRSDINLGGVDKIELEVIDSEEIETAQANSDELTPVISDSKDDLSGGQNPSDTPAAIANSKPDSRATVEPPAPAADPVGATQSAAEPTPSLDSQPGATANPATTVPSPEAPASNVPPVPAPGATAPASPAPAPTSSPNSNPAASANNLPTPAGNPTPAKSDERSNRPPTPPAKDKPTETLRVDIERLDQLMNLSGQLVINKAQFAQISDQFKGLATRKQSVHRLSSANSMLDRILADANTFRGSSPESAFAQQVRSHITQIKEELSVVGHDIAQLRKARNTVGQLSEAVHQLDRIADGIQKSVMDTRMVPIGPLFGRFKRVVRDITRSNGKDVQLVIRGEKTELDKRMIDELADPLIHMVRNSADHGIESREDRIAAGKPARGTITLDAFHRGNRVLVQIRDDGKGLDSNKIRAKAIDKGIITAQDAERLTKQQTFQLIWEPGFSTAEKVTEVSGRGMGMDIVRSKIEQLNGTVELDSEEGVGTTITIKLPLTMAILPSLLIVISGDVFAIPVESVVEIVRVSGSDLGTVQGVNTASVRGRVISMVELSDLFHWNQPSDHKSNERGEKTLVVVGSDGEELGLAVDELLGEGDIVIKSLAENYQNVLGLAGASILGDGRVSLILDVAALINMACREAPADESNS